MSATTACHCINFCRSAIHMLLLRRECWQTFVTARPTKKADCSRKTEQLCRSNYTMMMWRPSTHLAQTQKCTSLVCDCKYTHVTSKMQLTIIINDCRVILLHFGKFGPQAPIHPRQHLSPCHSEGLCHPDLWCRFHPRALCGSCTEAGGRYTYILSIMDYNLHCTYQLYTIYYALCFIHELP